MSSTDNWPSPDELRAALDGHARSDFPALPGRTNHLSAGVLVPMVWGAELTVVVTLRPPTLRNHASEVCFPGGGPEPADPDLLGTALREAEEELGIAQANVLGALSSVPLYTSDYRLHPFVAQIEETPLTPQPGEVAAVIQISLDQMFRKEEIGAIAWQMDGDERLSPVFVVDGHPMFGGTAHVFGELCSVLAKLTGRRLPKLAPGRWIWDMAAGRPKRAAQ